MCHPHHSNLKTFKIQNVNVHAQGDWLIEVPVEQEKRVPKDWLRVCGTKKVRPA